MRLARRCGLLAALAPVSCDSASLAGGSKAVNGSGATNSGNARPDQDGASSSPAPSPAADGVSVIPADSETAKATAPVSVTGTFLVDCGYADEKGTRCVLLDKKSNLKANTTLAGMSITNSYSNGTQDQPSVTLAAAADPWHFYFQTLPGMRVLLTNVRVQGTVGGDSAFAQDAESLVYVPAVLALKTQASTFAPTTMVFVTRNRFTPGLDFTSAEQADSLCKAVAGSSKSIVAKPTLTWWAIIAGVQGAGGAVGSALRMPGVTGTLVDAVNGVLGTDTNALFNTGNNLLNRSITLDETGNAVAGTGVVWTGDNADSSPSGNSCGGWAQRTGVGTVGSLANKQNFLQSTTQSCDSYGHLYCISVPK